MILAYPWALLLGIPVLLAGWVAWRRRPPALRLPTTGHLWQEGRAQWRRRLPLGMEVAGGVLLTLALARPQRVLEVVREERQAVDIMLALDVSGSMDAVDIPPAATPEQAAGRPTRLQSARREISRLVASRPEDRFGLVVFARRPYPACPLTFDHELLEARLQDITTELLDDGTGLTSAIALAALQLRGTPSTHRVLVLVTDGRNNVPADQPPEAAAALARQQGLVLHVIGVGSQNAVLPVRTLAGPQYRPVETAIDEAGLRAIAAQGGGTFLLAGDDAGFAAAVARIDALEKGRVVRTVRQPRQEFFPGLTFGALALLCLAFALSCTTCRTLP